MNDLPPPPASSRRERAGEEARTGEGKRWSLAFSLIFFLSISLLFWLVLFWILFL